MASSSMNRRARLFLQLSEQIGIGVVRCDGQIKSQKQHCRSRVVIDVVTITYRACIQICPRITARPPRQSSPHPDYSVPTTPQPRPRLLLSTRRPQSQFHRRPSHPHPSHPHSRRTRYPSWSITPSIRPCRKRQRTASPAFGTCSPQAGTLLSRRA